MDCPWVCVDFRKTDYGDIRIKELIQLQHGKHTNTYTNSEAKFRKNDITCEKCFHLRQRLQRKATQ